MCPCVQDRTEAPHSHSPLVPFKQMQLVRKKLRGPLTAVAFTYKHVRTRCGALWGRGHHSYFKTTSLIIVNENILFKITRLCLYGDQMTPAARGNIALGEGSLNILNPYLHKSTLKS